MLERLGLRRKVESPKAATRESVSDLIRKAAEEGVKQGQLNLNDYSAMLSEAREIERQSSSANNS